MKGLGVGWLCTSLLASNTMGFVCRPPGRRRAPTQHLACGPVCTSSTGEKERGPHKDRRPHAGLTRKQQLGLPLLVIGLGSQRVQAKESDAREAVAKVASFIPGYGQPDTFYPDYFEGTWQLTRECVGVTVPEGSNLGDEEREVLEEALARVGEKVTYPVLFGRLSGPSGEVVAERSFNEASLWKARSADKTELYRDAITPSWSSSNPNVLTVSFPDGLTREVKVTKRNFEKPSEETFGVSEYCRIADARQDTGIASVPRLSAVRVLTRYRRARGGTIEGLELTQYFPTVSLSPDPPALFTVKSRLRLEPFTGGR